ncbi:MAG: prephenate dehydrogenase/arogenate dehydrogenase family protein [Nitrospirota bacterium]
MEKPKFNKITILGVGLIGASFALAVKKNGLCGEIVGFGRNTENLIRAKERGIIDSFALSASDACRDSDLIMFATPVGAFLDLARQARSSLKKGAIVTDAGSVKGNLVYEMEKLMPADVHYIGGHPISGSDRSGMDSSNAELFTNSKCIITPTENSDPVVLKIIVDLWMILGSKVIKMDPEKHDRIYAAVSHLPHLIAYAIVNSVADVDSSYLEFCGQGFKDTTRIASSSHELWKDICLLNRDNLIEMISVFQQNLDRLGQYLRASDSDSLEREFRKARTLREGIGQN